MSYETGYYSVGDLELSTFRLEGHRGVLEVFSDGGAIAMLDRSEVVELVQLLQTLLDRGEV